MKHSQHTPGPWIVAYGSIYTDSNVCIGHADRDEDATRPTERDANVRLMAEAPAMLEALRAAVNDWRAVSPRHSSAPDWLPDALALLSRIEGETK
jgi:hypothetical protein